MDLLVGSDLCIFGSFHIFMSVWITSLVRLTASSSWCILNVHSHVYVDRWKLMSRNGQDGTCLLKSISTGWFNQPDKLVYLHGMVQSLQVFKIFLYGYPRVSNDFLRRLGNHIDPRLFLGGSWTTCLGPATWQEFRKPLGVTLPETNSLFWKSMVGRWHVLLRWPIFRGEPLVSETEKWWCKPSFSFFGMVYHLESRCHNSHVLVDHGPLQIATFWELWFIYFHHKRFKLLFGWSISDGHLPY